jgi:ketosteroid isomerase-like protein
MSQENVEIARRHWEALDRALDAFWERPRSAVAELESGDLSPEFQEVLRYMDPEVDWNTAFAGVSFHGHLGAAQGWDWWMEAVDFYTVTVKDITDLGGSKVLVAVESTLRSEARDLDVTAPLFSVVTLRAGLIARMDEYTNRNDALAAVGLSE